MLDRRTDRRHAATARARKARFRQRRRDGCFVAPVEVTPAILDCLIGLDHLRERDAADPRRVGAAIAALLADTARK